MNFLTKEKGALWDAQEALKELGGESEGEHEVEEIQQEKLEEAKATSKKRKLLDVGVVNTSSKPIASRPIGGTFEKEDALITLHMDGLDFMRARWKACEQVLEQLGKIFGQNSMEGLLEVAKGAAQAPSKLEQMMEQMKDLKLKNEGLKEVAEGCDKKVEDARRMVEGAIKALREFEGFMGLSGDVQNRLVLLDTMLGEGRTEIEKARLAKFMVDRAARMAAANEALKTLYHTLLDPFWPPRDVGQPIGNPSLSPLKNLEVHTPKD